MPQTRIGARAASFLLCLLVASSAARAESGSQPRAAALPLADAVAELATRLAASDAAARPLRVAFLALAPVGAAAAEGKGFGAFFSERLAAQAKGASPKIRIFERQRLEDILAEHELDSSGAVDSEGALKIGELVPVDAVFTGSYARSGNAVAVNARLVSVVTGEVLFAQAISIAMDEAVRGFFADSKLGADETAPSPLTEEERLKAAIDEMKVLLADLGSESKVTAVATKASTYPLFGTFAPLHELVAGTLKRYGKTSPAYRAYLVSSLSSAPALGSNMDVYALIDALDFLALDGTIDDEEFAAGLAACRAMSSIGYYDVAFIHLLSGTSKGPVPQAQRAKLGARIGAIMTDIAAGRMGKPAGVEYSRGLLELLGALQDDGEAFLATYDSSIALVPVEKLPGFASPLKRRFSAEDDPRRKSALLACIGDNATVCFALSANAAQDIYSFFYSLDRKDETRDYARDFAAHYGALLSKAIAAVPYNKEDRTLLCLRYGIDCPSIVPSFDDIVRGLLLGDGIEAKRASAKMLEAMGSRAAPAEPTVRKVLGYIRDGSIDGMGSPNLQMECLDILANIGTRDPKSLELVASALRHSYSDVREAAAAACLKIGSASVPYVAEVAASGAKEQRLDALKLLAKMGKDASAAKPTLERALESEKDGYMRDALADTISRIKP